MLTALYSVRSERLFCEQLGYHLLWLWFLDREFPEGRFDPSIFAKNYERVLSADVAKLFFLEVYDLSRQAGWTSDDHFTADATHQSTTDPDSVLYRKASGQEARLCFGAHALLENRNGLCADFTLHNPITESEPVVALQQADAHRQLYPGVTLKTIGADKSYHQQGFVQGCRARAIAPHVACKDKVKVAGLDGRTTTQRSYQVSLRIRKRVEEIFGWIKTGGGFRRSRYRGRERTQAWGCFVAGTDNLRLLARLAAA